MGRSQRHMLWEQGATAAGEIHAQGVVAPGIAQQVDPQALNVLKAGAPLYNDGLELKQPREEAGVVVPVGEPGGPLSGSTLTGAIPEELVPPPAPDTDPGPDPEPGMEPTLTSLDPDTAVLGSADITLRCLGTNFTDTSVIHFSDHDEPTTFVSDTELTTGVKPSLGWGAVALPVTVKQGSFETGPLDFTFTETVEGAMRSFPIGPVTLARVEDDPLGIRLTPSEALDVQVGDTVNIEATGSTPMNGTYTVLSVDPLVVDNTTELASPIDGKGRVTVLGGAA